MGAEKEKKAARPSFYGGFLPAGAMALLMLAEFLTARGLIRMNYWVYCGLQVMVFALPALLMIVLRRGRKMDLSLLRGGFTPRALPFVLNFSCMLSLLSFAVNLGVSRLMNGTGGASLAAGSGMSGWQALLAVALLPALLEEFFFRGLLMSCWKDGGTLCALLVSALTFAMLHGTPENFAGPLVAGFFYGFLTWSFGSVWPAVLAHFINNSYYLLMNHLMRSYASFGIWPYFVALSLLVLCIFLYFSMSSLGKLIERGKVRRFDHAPLPAALLSVLASPGLWLTAMLFAVQLIYL